MKKRGFTLIELLVVIAIIGILATILLVSFSNAQAKSRDSKRMADVEAIGSAVEMYYVDNKHYPIIDELSGPDKCYSRCRSTNNSRWDNILTNHLKGYIADSLPKDPYNGRNPETSYRDLPIWQVPTTSTVDYFYTYYSSINSYMIGARMEAKAGNGEFFAGKNLKKITTPGVCVDPSLTSAEGAPAAGSAILKQVYMIGKNVAVPVTP